MDAMITSKGNKITGKVEMLKGGQFTTFGE
jgi:hypothetical protein